MYQLGVAAAVVSGGIAVANVTAATNITVFTLSPVVVLARSGSVWMVPANTTLVLDGTITGQRSERKGARAKERGAKEREQRSRGKGSRTKERG